MLIEWVDGVGNRTNPQDNVGPVFGRIGWVDDDGEAWNKYWIGSVQFDGSCLVDVSKVVTDNNYHNSDRWHGLDIRMNSREQALAWCEMVEATGAY